MTVEDRTSGPTKAQREWVKRLGTIAPAEAASAEDTKAFIGPGDIPGIIKGLLTDLFANCKLKNKTDRVLTLIPGSIKFESGKMKTSPPNEIDANDTGEFVAVNKFPNTAGVSGELRYALDDKGTTWKIVWNNPRAGSNTADSKVEGPDPAAVALFKQPKFVAGPGENAEFTYTLELKGGGQPPVPPVPPPTPATDVKTACILTVDNQTQFPLTLLDDGHDRGNFVPLPPRTVPPKSSVQFTSVETPGAKEQGCKGFLLYEVGTPTKVQWRVEWDNPEQAKNTTSASLTPADPSLRSLDQIGQGEDNVPVLFTLRETGGGGPGPVPPVPPVPPVDPVDPPFEPPASSKQPTLRRGDKSKDGWVEYLQFLLNHHVRAGLEMDGDFGQATERAVVRFQTEKKLQVDKVVGNQTWAALREGAPEMPSTDGRKPHTFVEKGAEARWSTEKDDAFYMTSTDELILEVNSVGDTPVEGLLATLKITPPGGKVRVVKVPIGPATRTLPTGGAFHNVVVQGLKAKFPPGNPAAKITEYVIEGYLDAELGGDRWKGGILEI